MQIYTSWGPGPLLFGYVDAEAESSSSCILYLYQAVLGLTAVQLETSKG